VGRRDAAYGRGMDPTPASGTVNAGLQAEFGPGRLFLADSRIALGALNYVRHQALERVFGVPREYANIVTFALAVGAADAAYETSRRIVRAPHLPSAGDTAVGAIALRDAALGVAGPANRKAPLVGTLLAVAMLGGAALPVLRRTGVRLRAAEQRARERRIGRYQAATRAPAG
jgi:hypothetical protein